MPRSIWKGAVSFGLVTIPVKVYGATETKDVSFNQVHEADGGKIRYKRVCEECGQEVAFSDIAKAWTAADGRTAVLTKEDLDELPLSSAKSVDVVQFVDAAEIDPTYFEKTYYLEAEGPGEKPYVLLRDAMAKTGKSAIVKVALRGRESLALIRPKDGALVMHTMLWPDEVRDGSFATPGENVTATDAEVGMAEMFIDQMTQPFEPEAFVDSYREAVEALVTAKLEGVEAPEGKPGTATSGEVVDLVAALKASVEAAKKKRADAAAAGASSEAAEAAETKKPAARKKKAS